MDSSSSPRALAPAPAPAVAAANGNDFGGAAEGCGAALLPGDTRCIICLGMALPPLRTPCNCSSLQCVSCFEKTLDNFGGNCATCKIRLRSKIRRQKGKTTREKLEAYVDHALFEQMRVQFPDQVAQYEAGESDICLPKDDSEVLMRRQELRKGELREHYERERERVVAEFRAEREMEENETLKYLKDDEEGKRLLEENRIAMEKIEQARRDAEFARKLAEDMENEAAASSKSNGNDDAGSHHNSSHRHNRAVVSGNVSSNASAMFAAFKKNSNDDHHDDATNGGEEIAGESCIDEPLHSDIYLRKEQENVTRINGLTMDGSAGWMVPPSRQGIAATKRKVRESSWTCKKCRERNSILFRRCSRCLVKPDWTPMKKQRRSSASSSRCPPLPVAAAADVIDLSFD